MADNKNMVKFGRGTKSLEDFKLVTGYENMVYFNTKDKEIYVGDNKYGFSETDKGLLNSAVDNISYDETTATFTVSFVDTTKDDVTFSIPTADKKTPGLMTGDQVTDLGNVKTSMGVLLGDASTEVAGVKSLKKVEADAKAYADEKVNALDMAEAGVEGKAIVKIKQEDGQVTAEAGVVAAEYVSLKDTAEKYAASTVEGAFAEIATRLGNLDTSASNVAGQIKAAVEALDSEKEGTSAHVNVKVTQVDGKIDSVVVTNTDIASEADLNTLSQSVGTSSDAAKADGSVYARIAALVAEDGALSGRLDALEGEDGAVAEALAEAKEYADGLVAGLDANVSSAAGQKLTVNVVEVDGKVTEVNVTDHDIASAATLAALKEDVDLFFKDASFAADAKDTLKELQEYITSDVAGAASMAESIAANKAAIEKEVTDRENAIKGLNTPTGGVKGEGTFVDVTVVQEAGVITSVTVDEADIASAAALKSLSDTVGTSSDGKEVATVYGAIAAEADARTQAVNAINDKISEVEGTIASNKTAAEEYADAAVKVLEDGKVAANAAAIAQEIEDRQDGDEATLASANAYTDNALTWYED